MIERMFYYAKTLDVTRATVHSAANRIVEVYVQPLLPDDTRCTRDNQPSGGGI